MKRILLVLAVVVVLTVVFSSIASSESTDVKACKLDCQSQLRLALKNCNSDGTACVSSCISAEKSCRNDSKEKYSSCTSLCGLDNKCKKNCRTDLIKENVECSSWSCKSLCNSQRRYCIQTFNALGRTSNLQCNLGIYPNFTNFTLNHEIKEDYAISSSYCANNGGLYQQLCTGPYFDIKCTNMKFCLCSGKNNYSCPADYYCQTNFSAKDFSMPAVSIKGWKNLIGEDLGKAGLCTKNSSVIF